MRRVVVIGCGGSGKTTVGRRLGALLDVNVTHLDGVYYDDEWRELSQERFASVQEQLVSASAWVIDGNYASTLSIRLKAADTVIFLDMSSMTCLWGLLRRRLRHGRGQHRSIGVYDRITWGFVKYVWNYRRAMAPRIRALIDQHAGHASVHICRSRAEINRLLDQITEAARR